MTFYFMGVSNEKGMCMKRPKLWETVTTPTCITVYGAAVVRTIAPGCNHYNTRLSSQGRKQHSAGRGPGKGGEGRTPAPASSPPSSGIWRQPSDVTTLN